MKHARKNDTGKLFLTRENAIVVRFFVLYRADPDPHPELLNGSGSFKKHRILKDLDPHPDHVTRSKISYVR